jgi:hypothetical protein
MNSVKAGVAYFVVVFAAGFVLGTLRVLAIAPRIGETAAVLVELPVILTVSWFACGWIVSGFLKGSGAGSLLAMGAVAFVLLMAAEAGLSVSAFGRTVGEHLDTYRTAGGAVGLAGQVVFALLPLIRGLRKTPAL